MSNLFGHENLRVYTVAVEFVTLGDSLLKSVEGKAVACGHLSRAMEGIPLHIAHANNSWSAKERITYLGNGRFTAADHARFLGIAHSATVQSAAILDLAVARHIVDTDHTQQGRQMLERISAMLTVMAKNLKYS